MLKVLITILVVTSSSLVFAETYTKVDDNTVTITKPMVYTVTVKELKEILVNLDKEKAAISQRLIEIDKAVIEVNKTLSEAQKVGVNTGKTE